jgi:hypothetical protein
MRRVLVVLNHLDLGRFLLKVKPHLNIPTLIIIRLIHALVVAPNYLKPRAFIKVRSHKPLKIQVTIRIYDDATCRYAPINSHISNCATTMLVL